MKYGIQEEDSTTKKQFISTKEVWKKGAVRQKEVKGKVNRVEKKPYENKDDVLSTIQREQLRF